MIKLGYSLLVGLFLGSAIDVPIQAQITVDGTTNTTLIPTDNGVRIDEGNRFGANLFHSFSEFSVLKGTEAFFNNPNDIVNIFSRVTGGNISSIDGLIRANGTANLFLINPAGIIFGEGASLDIGGSFLGSTADSIVFSDGEFLATDSDNSPLLTINMPIGLNFSNNPGEIAVEGSKLQVNNGEALAFLGGQVRITRGEIAAPGGRVELGGVAQEGQVSLNQQKSGEFGIFDSISFPPGIERADVTLTNAAEVDVRAAGGGSIRVNGRNIELSGGDLGASNFRAGIAKDSDFPEAQAGDITLDATDTITVSQGSGIRNQVAESGVGNAGGINITTANLSLIQGGFVSTSTFGQGDGGAITIKASGTIRADGEDQNRFNSGIFSQVNPTGVGNSGGINISTANLSLTQGGEVSANTLGQGDAGAITIKASGTIFADGEDQDGFASGIFSQVAKSGVGDSGGIDLTTANLFLKQGGRVSATTLGQGDAGAITIEASETISADGEDSDGVNSGIRSQVNPTGVGTSGGINISTANLSLTQGGLVDASTFGQGDAGAITIKASGTISAEGENQAGFNSGIFSKVESEAIGKSKGINITTANLSLTQGGQVSASTVGQGNAGAIKIKASGTISADGSGTIFNEEEIQAGSGIFSTAGQTGEGDAADININTNNLSLTNDAEISVRSLGQGNARNLDLKANSLTLENGASLFASTPVGTGGNITLQIADDLTLRDNSTISARATDDADGGNINIDAEFIIAFPNQNNDIIARAQQGNGGNINIYTNAIFGIEERSSTPPNNTNDIDASSEFGLDGEVEINQLDVNPAQGLEELPTSIINVTRLIAQNLCQLGKGSEFIVTGKGGLAPSPSQARDGDVIEVVWVEPATFSEDGEVERSEALREAKGLGAGVADEEIVEAQGWMINDRGILELVAYKTDINGSPAQPKDTKICNK